MTGASERLNELSNLEDGWYWGDGLAPTAAAINASRDLVNILPKQLEDPGIFPTPDGGVLIEWAALRETRLDSIDILPDGSFELWVFDEPNLPLTTGTASEALKLLLEHSTTASQSNEDPAQ